MRPSLFIPVERSAHFDTQGRGDFRLRIRSRWLSGCCSGGVDSRWLNDGCRRRRQGAADQALAAA
jgi:hypothetical protein